jgi:hypothetical protein
MKEVFTKSFWQGVKKTFDQALEDPPSADRAPMTPAEDDPSAPSTSGTPSSPSVPSGTSETSI